MLYLSLVHEMLIVPEESTESGINSDLRIIIGEKLIIVIVPEIISDIASLSNEGKDVQEKMKSNLNEMVRQWEEKDVFGGPTIIMEVKDLIQNSQKASDNTTTTVGGGGAPINNVVKVGEEEIAVATTTMANVATASQTEEDKESKAASSNATEEGNTDSDAKMKPTQPAVVEKLGGDFDFEKEVSCTLSRIMYDSLFLYRRIL